MQKLSASEVVTTVEAIESPLPAPIQEALGELVGAAREGLLALSVGVGLGVVHELLELELDEAVGPKGKHNPERVAVRHGHEDGSMTLGGRCVPVRRLRMRTADEERELPVHKERNVCDLVPERDRDQVRARMRAAWALTDPELAQGRLELLASELDRTWPDAAGSLREGLHDTLTLMRLGITGPLAKTLCSTNPCESMLEIVRSTQRNVKRWRAGDMRRRWTAAGHARRRATVPPHHRLPRPRQARHRHRASRHHRRRERPRPSGEPRARYRLTINQEIAAEVPRRSGQPRCLRAG